MWVTVLKRLLADKINPILTVFLKWELMSLTLTLMPLTLSLFCGFAESAIVTGLFGEWLVWNITDTEEAWAQPNQSGSQQLLKVLFFKLTLSMCHISFFLSFKEKQTPMSMKALCVIPPLSPESWAVRVQKVKESLETPRRPWRKGRHMVSKCFFVFLKNKAKLHLIFSNGSKTAERR